MSAALRLVTSTGDRGGEVPPIDAYELWMRGRGLAARTIGETVCTLRRLQHTSGYPIEATPTLAVSRFLASDRLGARARYTYFGHLRGFFRWCADNGHGADAMATLPRPRMPRCTPRPITTGQLQALLGLPLRRKTRAMVMLAGLRAHEIAKVKGQDVDPDARTLYVIGKGGHAASIPLHPALVDIARTMPARGWWFPGNATRPGQHINSRAVVDAISDACTRADIPGRTAHRLRHWYGTNLVASGRICEPRKPCCGTKTSPPQRSTPRSRTGSGCRRSTGSTRSGPADDTVEIGERACGREITPVLTRQTADELRQAAELLAAADQIEHAR